ncbi:MAG: hypothetical protein OXC60_17040 [Litoreibacter sp.]|nr:hypothetical protein [Litoreibacter sp.]
MEEAELVDALRRLRSYERLPSKERARATKLLARLETPVRVTVLGPNETHAQELIGALLGEELPPLPSAPITFGHGPTERVLAIRPCGTIEDVAHHQGPTAALFFESPAPFLATVQLTSFPWHITREAPPNFSEIDIALWCSDSFDEEELALWDAAPNILKDHSFLLATQPSDIEIAEVEFLSVYSAKTPQAAASSYSAAARDLRARVSSGRSADFDNAALFVETQREALEAAPPAPAVAASKTALPANVEIEPRVPRSTQPPTASVDRALNLLRQDASYMLSALDGDQDQAYDAVLTQCAETGQTLTDLMEEAGWASAEPALLEEVVACADRLVLLCMEGGAAPAIEAVSTLYQLKRDFEARSAA